MAKHLETMEKTFYTNVFCRGNTIYVRGFAGGRRFSDEIPYKPYLFTANGPINSKFKDLDGNPVERKRFDSIRDARDFTRKFEGVHGFKYYGLTQFQYTWIYDNFSNEIDYDASLISVVSLDIENSMRDSTGQKRFPNFEDPDNALTTIALRKNGKTLSLGYKHCVPSNPSVEFVMCEDEKDMLEAFLLAWESEEWAPDVVTGWNIEGYDIPMLVGRIKKVLGEKAMRRLSPYGFVDAKTTFQKGGREVNTFTFAGIAILDYMVLYKKFTFKNHESYKLDDIAFNELKINKLDYSEYEDLDDLYDKNFTLYVDYNAVDVEIIEKLEAKLGFIQLVFAFAYSSLVCYEDTLATVRPWDVIIHNYLMDQGVVIPQRDEEQNYSSIEGGYVKEVKAGKYDWIVSFDLNSLYPHLIMQYNISPETLMGRVPMGTSVDMFLQGMPANLTDQLKNNDVALAANGTIYDRSRKGFLPILMEMKYDDRVKYKALMQKARLAFNETKDKAQEALAIRYHNLQLAAKIALNAAYGALANEYFRWFSQDLAEGITKSGQLSIRFIEGKMNGFMNEMLGTKGVDYVIASDTDSIYLDFGPLIEKLGLTDVDQIAKAIDQFCEEKIQSFIDESYQELADRMNAYDQKMKMKRESIAISGIWTGAKNYALYVKDDEGVYLDEPVIKMKGISAVKSSTPKKVREAIKSALMIIMTGTESKIHSFVKKFKSEFMELPFHEVASPSGINGIHKYSDRQTIFKTGTPMHVKGALFYNHLVRQKGLDGKLPLLTDGDKIKYSYLRTPNPLQSTVIAFPAEIPEDLAYIDKYVDREAQFEKTFGKSLDIILRPIGWTSEKKATLEDFFS